MKPQDDGVPKTIQVPRALHDRLRRLAYERREHQTTIIYRALEEYLDRIENEAK